jgi:hypothetical protein
VVIKAAKGVVGSILLANRGRSLQPVRSEIGLNKNVSKINANADQTKQARHLLAIAAGAQFTLNRQLAYACTTEILPS